MICFRCCDTAEIYPNCRFCPSAGDFCGHLPAEKHFKNLTSCCLAITRHRGLGSSIVIIQGSLGVKLPTIWTDEKQSRAEAERRERLEERRSEKRKSQKKEDADAWKVGKVAKHCVFPMICGYGGSKSRLAKAADAEPAGQTRDEKLHVVVARSTFPSQNVQNTPWSEHFWKLRCQKSARRCGAKHISKSKCTKHTRFGPLLEVEMSKKCTPLWREAHFQVKMHKTHHHGRTTFGSWDVEKVHAVVARSTFRSQNVQNTPFSDHFWRFRCRKSARRCGAKHISKSKCKKHQGFGPLLEVQMSLRFTTLHYTTLHSTTLHYTTLQLQLHNYIPLNSTTLNYITLHYITLPYTPLHYITLHYTPLHYTTLHYTTFHYTSLHYTTLHSTTLQLQLRLHNYTPLHEITLHYITLHYTPLHYTTLHYTTLHSTTLHYITLHYTTTTTTTTQLHSTTLHYTKLHYTTLHYTTLHYTTLHYTTLHYTTLPSTTLHYITLHYTTFTTLRYTTLHYTTLHWMTLHHR